jgi:hypothetical protein
LYVVPEALSTGVAMVLGLEPDTTSAPNPTSGKAVTREGPIS